MSNPLPVIVSFGGMNAAGRSSGHEAYQRMIYEGLSASQQKHRVASLASLMGLESSDEAGVLAGTLVRRIERSHFDVDNVPSAKRTVLNPKQSQPASFVMARKDLPETLPPHWSVSPLDADERSVRVDLESSQTLMVDTAATMPVQSAGQLPSGFDPAALYRSTHHPRGLQLAILGASDAINSLGIAWQEIMECIAADQVAVYASSVMSQLDANGYGGMISARRRADRVSSKQLALGFNSMPADFINAYVLGSVGATGAVTGACASFLYNLCHAVEDIKSGRRKVVVVGASEAPVLPEVIDGYAAMSALASDDGLRKLDGLSADALPNHRRASRPFGDNCGFTIAESCQYVVLMADDLALELGADVYGAVPGVYVNADGPKKSISSPGAGNYLTLAKAVG
ncbi:MAG: beta-ketoacyl synthase, partial [Cellvibrionaceae bacterium]|nr:beta-ketoacyl synthase [Cellvibrionaceae bacterium]